MATEPLHPDQLYRRCEADHLDFETTAELDPFDGFLGQGRAADALRFGVGMRHKGYNLFVLGPSGMVRHALARREIERRAAAEPEPSDWCYVHNFKDMHRPRALRLPPGRGAELKHDCEALIGGLHGAIDSVFESDEYRTRVQAIHEVFEEQQEQAFDAIQQRAKEQGIALLRTPTGITLAPLHDGKPMGPDQFHELPKAERERIEADISALQDELHKVMHQVPLWKKRTDEQVESLNPRFDRGRRRRAVRGPGGEVRRDRRGRRALPPGGGRCGRALPGLHVGPERETDPVRAADARGRWPRMAAALPTAIDFSPRVFSSSACDGAGGSRADRGRRGSCVADCDPRGSW